MLWIPAALAAGALLWLSLLCGRLPRRPLEGLTGRDYAHRGLWNAERPENSLPAFRAAVEKGYGIEFDVHLTSDGRLVVFHDDTLQRMCGDSRAVSACTLAELRALRLNGGPEGIPTLDEVLETVDARVPLIIELKSDRRITELAALTDRRLRDYPGVYCIESFDPRAVRWYRRHRPDVIRGQLAFGLVAPRETHFGRSGGRVPERYRHGRQERFLASLTEMALGRPDFLAFDFRTAHSLPFRAACLFRPHLVAWTVRSQADMDSLRGRWELQIFERFEAEPPQNVIPGREPLT